MIWDDVFIFLDFLHYSLQKNKPTHNVRTHHGRFSSGSRNLLGPYVLLKYQIDHEPTAH